MAKRALCIGINDYPGTESDLAGCVNDATDWAEALGQRGFTVSRLTDAESTKARMVEQIGALIGGAIRGDTVVITYSGHGTWVPDQNGDEPDARDEALCPWDIGAGHVLLDDEIHDLFTDRAAGVRVLLISDSCHSGSVTRGDEADLDPGMPRARFLPPAAWMKAVDLPRATARPLNLLGGMRQSGGDLLLAGCLDTQFSWDTRFNGRPNGAFTYYALKTLKTLPATASYEDWFRQIRNYLPSTRLPQDPQIFGTRTARRFKVLA
jgi:hypothetical protein